MATQEPPAQKPTTVSNAGSHTTLKVVKNLKTLHPHTYATGGHPANYKGCMVYHDLVSAIYRYYSLYERRINVRTILTKQQQQVSHNVQNTTLSYGQAVRAITTDATSNSNQLRLIGS
jgi:hypothetical protein